MNERERNERQKKKRQKIMQDLLAGQSLSQLEENDCLWKILGEKKLCWNTFTHGNGPCLLNVFWTNGVRSSERLLSTAYSNAYLMPCIRPCYGGSRSSLTQSDVGWSKTIHEASTVIWQEIAAFAHSLKSIHAIDLLANVRISASQKIAACLRSSYFSVRFLDATA